MAIAFKTNIANGIIKSYQRVIGGLFTDDSCDVEFCFNGDDKTQIVRAHTTYLALISPVFKSMFNGNWKENDNNVKIEDANYDDFEAFMQCVYGKEIEINHDNVDALVYLSNKYNIDDISNDCSTFMIQQLSIENVLNCLNNAIIYDFAELQDACEKVVSENTAAVFNLPQFLECNKNTLTAILKLNKVSCAEVKVFNNCMKWAKQRCHEKELDESGENIRKELGDCWPLIRFKEMSFAEFVQKCELYKSGLFSGDLLCELMVYFHREGIVASKRYATQVRPQIDFTFGPIGKEEIGDSAECTIQFSTSKPLVLTKVAHSSILWETTDGWVGRPLTIVIRITKDDQTIQKNTYADRESDWWILNLVEKILIDGGEYKLSVKIEPAKKIGRNFVNIYDIKGNTKDGVSLIMTPNHASVGKDQPNIIKALHFEKFDKSYFHLVKTTDPK